MPQPARGDFTGSPSTVTVPLSTFTNPATIFRSVDLPQPEGPNKQTNSSGSAENETSLSTNNCLRPPSIEYVFEIFLNSIDTNIAPSEGGELNQIRAVDDCFALLAFLHAVSFLDLTRRKTCGSSANEPLK